jgi:hypothetical protein
MALLIVNPGFSLCSNPGLKLANAFGVKFKLKHHYQIEDFARKVRPSRFKITVCDLKHSKQFREVFFATTRVAAVLTNRTTFIG